MIRNVLLAVAFLLAGTASFHLYGETRYVLAARKSIPELLGPTGSGVLIVMQPADCPGSGELVAHAGALHRAGRFPVEGLVIGANGLSPLQRELFERHRVAFPLRAIGREHAAAVAEKLGYTATPFVVVLDRRSRVVASASTLRNMPPELLEQLVAGKPALSSTSPSRD